MNDFESIMQNPMFQMGLGILANNGPGATFGQAVGGGALTGMQNLQQMQLLKEQAEDRKLRAEFTKVQIEEIKKEAQIQAEMQQKQAAYMENLRQTDPQMAAQYEQFQMMGKDAYGAFNPEPMKPPTGMRLGPNGEWIADPNYLDMQSRLKQAGATRITNALSMPSMLNENEYAKTLGKEVATQDVKILAGADRARNSQIRTQQFKFLLDEWAKSGGEPGKLQPLMTDIKGFAKALGLDPEKAGFSAIGPAEALTALGNEMALGKIGAEEGGMPANNFSDADRKFVVSTVPQLENTPEGIQYKLLIQDKMDQRALEREQFLLENQNKSPLERRKMWSKYVKENPLFDGMSSPVVSTPAFNIDRGAIDAELRRRGLK